jgi:hypothetical protein
MKTLLLLACIGLSAAPPSKSPPVLGPYSTAVNIALDLAGKPDLVNGGTSDAFASKIEFHPPTGYRTHVTRVYGDFISWPRAGTIPAGTSSEVGWGIKNTLPDGSTQVTYPGYTATPYDNSFVWYQGVLTPQQPYCRIHFDQDVSVGGVLAADNMMLSQPFIALNTTGLIIHQETTYVVIYQFEQK